MTTEEKAKRYDEVINRMKHYVVDEYGCTRIKVADVFPEFKESEDELTWSKNYISEEAYYLSMDIRDDEDRIKPQKLQKSFAWLENQCEQKPVEWGEEDENECNHILKILNLVAEEQETKGYNNLISSVNWLKSLKDRIQSKPRKKKSEQKSANKIEPKFKVGDWIVQENIGVYKVIEVCECWYEVVDNRDKNYSIGFDKEYMLRLWTINDAKDGDVLATWAGAFIYNGNNGGGGCPGCYCGINTLGNFQTGAETHWTSKTVSPATKEQRDLLFEKMEETGYMWDSKNKELQEIEQNTTDKVEPKFKVGEWVVSPMGVYWHIDKISNNRYEVTSNTGASTDWPLNTKLYHRFTIQDAKPGDIIYAESKFNTFDFIGIFYTLENGNFWCYCDVSSDSDIYNDYLEYWEFDNDKGFVALNRYNFYPATKEQRDRLSEKMKEAGYEWDAEKKELKHL